MKDIKDIDKIQEAAQYDNSSRVRTAQIGEIVLWQNTMGYHCATKVEAIADDSRGAKSDNVTFSYKILENRKSDFSE